MTFHDSREQTLLVCYSTFFLLSMLTISPLFQLPTLREWYHFHSSWTPSSWSKSIIIIPLFLSESLIGMDIKLTNSFLAKWNFKTNLRKVRVRTLTKGFLSHNKKVLKRWPLPLYLCYVWMWCLELLKPFYYQIENETNGRKNKAKRIQRTEEHSGNTIPRLILPLDLLFCELIHYSYTT